MLSDADRAVLDFGSRFWKHAGAKEAAVVEQFGLSPTRYYQRVAALLRRPEAAAYAPATVRRLTARAAARR